METVTHMSGGQAAFVNALPIIFLVVLVIATVMAIRYFVRLGTDVRAIKQLLEDLKIQGK